MDRIRAWLTRWYLRSVLMDATLHGPHALCGLQYLPPVHHWKGTKYLSKLFYSHANIHWIFFSNCWAHRHSFCMGWQAKLYLSSVKILGPTITEPLPKVTEASGLLQVSTGTRPLFAVQWLSCALLFATPLTAACQASPPFTISRSWLRLMSTEPVMPSSHLALCCPLLILLSIFCSIRVFSNKSVLLIRWPKYWKFSFSISPSTEYSGLISFRMDCLDLLAIQRTLKSLLQNHSSKASILWCSAFFMVQISHP